jgi:hypothetical protein
VILPELAATGFVASSQLSGGRFGATFAGTFRGVPAVGKLDANPQPGAAFTAAVALAEAGLSPAVLYANMSSWVIITKQILPGITAVERQPDPALLGRRLKQLRFLPEALGSPKLKVFLSARLENVLCSGDVAVSSTVQTPEARFEALRILGDLPESDQVIHGDVSRGNILHGAAGDSGQSLWLVDPRGVTGDWQYDIAVASWKCRYDQDQLSVLCAASGADPDTVAAWLFVARAARV